MWVILKLAQDTASAAEYLSRYRASPAAAGLLACAWAAVHRPIARQYH
jgi:hypothetical protein